MAAKQVMDEAMKLGAKGKKFAEAHGGERL